LFYLSLLQNYPAYSLSFKNRASHV
jgi:hypothetical protein